MLGDCCPSTAKVQAEDLPAACAAVPSGPALCEVFWGCNTVNNRKNSFGITDCCSVKPSLNHGMLEQISKELQY